MPPMNSQLNTIDVGQTGAQNPAVVARAAEVPLRVAIVNVGPVLIFLAHADGVLINTPVRTGAYQLAPGKELVVVLVQKQGLWAAGNGIGGLLSVAISEAIPTKWMES